MSLAVGLASFALGPVEWDPVGPNDFPKGYSRPTQRDTLAPSLRVRDKYDTTEHGFYGHESLDAKIEYQYASNEWIADNRAMLEEMYEDQRDSIPDTFDEFCGYVFRNHRRD